jgi:hypothetical protein
VFKSVRVEVKTLIGEVIAAKCLECGKKLQRDNRYKFYHPRFEYTPKVCYGGPYALDMLTTNCELLTLAEDEYGISPYFDTTPTGSGHFRCEWIIPQ